MNLEIVFSRQAKKFVQKNLNLISAEKIADAVERAMRSIIRREDIPVDLIKMKGDWKGHWRVRIGGIRVIFRYEGGDPIIVNIEKVEFRGNVYD